MITATQIKTTNYYKNLDKIKRIFLTNHKTLRDIELGVNMTRLTTFKNWLKVCSPRHDTKKVVEELVNKKTLN